jgi:hypothetical protein
LPFVRVGLWCQRHQTIERPDPVAREAHDVLLVLDIA